MNSDLPDPLPSEWLPDPVAPSGPDDPDVWDGRIAELMAAAEPALERYQATHRLRWGATGRGWRWAAATTLAAAASLVIALGWGTVASPGVAQNSLVLVAVASESDPALFWAAINAETDPVLGLITLEGQQP